VSSDLVRQLRPGQLAVDGDPVTRTLFDRLDADDVAEIEGRIERDEMSRALHGTVTEDAEMRRLLLHLGVSLGVGAAHEKTGLLTALPPEDVHAMARGPMAAAGALYEADMVVSALLSAGVDPLTLRSALDFGSSSGRVVRVLQAAYPNVCWHGCDPNTEAIQWASEHLPAIEFFASTNEPPLPLADGALDLVYAISIWSHFEPALGLRWFEEMYRLLAPGTYLMFTTHGLTSIDHFHAGGVRSTGQSAEIREAMYSSGAWYKAEFGERGDWGVVNPQWGTAFVSPEWVLTNLLPRWQVLAFAPGRNHGNQDVYLVRRV
jgi:SAM-dependent methyltransferase